MPSIVTRAVIGVLLLWLPCTASPASTAFRPIVVSGDPVPGLGTGIVYTQIFWPTANQTGQLAYYGEFAGPGIDDSNNAAIWLMTDGAAQAVAREGGPAPGTRLAYTNFLEGAFDVSRTGQRIHLNDAGQVSFSARLPGLGLDSRPINGLWTTNGLAPQLIAVSGGQAPGTAPGVEFGESFTPAIVGDDGRATFWNHLAWPSTRPLRGPGVNTRLIDGIWRGEPGSPRLLVRSGTAVPGLSADTLFQFISFPISNAAGVTAFGSSFTGPNIDKTNDHGLWLIDEQDQLRLVARTGTAAPGTSADLEEFWRSTLSSNNGHLAWGGPLAGPGVDASNRYGIWANDGGITRLVARTGQATPQAPAGTRFDLIDPIAIANDGSVVFKGSLIGERIDNTNNKGIWWEVGGEIRLFVRAGDQAPGIAGHAVFRSDSLSPWVLDDGRIVLISVVRGDAVTNENSAGLWMTDEDGSLQLVVRSGDRVDISNDPLAPNFKTVDSFNAVEGQPYSRADELLLSLRFTDGTSGIFTATVPEPAGAMLLGLGILISGRRRLTHPIHRRRDRDTA